MHKDAYEYFRRWFKPKKGDEVLEVGSLDVNSTAQGFVLRKLAPKGVKWVGVDLKAGPGVDQVVEAGKPLPWLEPSFHWVLLSEVMEHDPDPAYTLRECYRVLRPEGRVILTTAGSSRRYHNPPHLVNFWPEGVYAMVSFAGFRVHHLELLAADLRCFAFKGAR